MSAAVESPVGFYVQLVRSRAEKGGDRDGYVDLVDRFEAAYTQYISRFPVVCGGLVGDVECDGSVGCRGLRSLGCDVRSAVGSGGGWQEGSGSSSVPLGLSPGVVCEGSGGSGQGTKKRGLNYERNQANRLRKKQQKQRQVFGSDEVVSDESVVQGKCETVLSAVSVDAGAQVPVWRRKQVNGKGFSAVRPLSSGFGRVFSVAEKEAQDSLARRRAAENAVAEKLAKMKLESLEDEQRCQEYADLKKQRLIQWRNESLAKSQASLKECKSIDPESSASQYEIRRQAKLCEDQKFQLEQVRKKYAELHGARAALEFLDATRAPGVDTEIAMEQDALMCEDFGNDSFWSSK